MQEIYITGHNVWPKIQGKISGFNTKYNFIILQLFKTNVKTYKLHIKVMLQTSKCIYKSKNHPCKINRYPFQIHKEFKHSSSNMLTHLIIDQTWSIPNQHNFHQHLQYKQRKAQGTNIATEKAGWAVIEQMQNPTFSSNIEFTKPSEWIWPASSTKYYLIYGTGSYLTLKVLILKARLIIITPNLIKLLIYHNWLFYSLIFHFPISPSP